MCYTSVLSWLSVSCVTAVGKIVVGTTGVDSVPVVSTVLADWVGVWSVRGLMGEGGVPAGRAV